MHKAFRTGSVAKRVLRKASRWVFRLVLIHTLSSLSLYLLPVHHLSPALNHELRKGMLLVGFNPVPPRDIYRETLKEELALWWARAAQSPCAAPQGQPSVGSGRDIWAVG